MGWDAWGEGRPKDAFVAECLASPKYAKGRWWVLERGRRPVSALIAYPLVVGGRPAAGIGSVQTEPALRGRGLAGLLLRAVMRRFEDEGVEVFALHSDIGAAYYARFGFEALPSRFQLKQGSTLMMRGPCETLQALWGDPAFRPPSYF